MKDILDQFTKEEMCNVVAGASDSLCKGFSDIIHNIGFENTHEEVFFMLNVCFNLVGNMVFGSSNPDKGYPIYEKNAKYFVEGLEQWFEQALKQKFDQMAGVKH